MRSLARPLGELHEHAAFFARARELRFLSVSCSPELRSAALDHLLQLEFHADNQSPWLAMEEAQLRSDAGWQLRGNRLATLWASRVEAYHDAGLRVGPVVASSDTTLAGFVEVVAQLLTGVCEPLSGFVGVIAPTIVEQPDAFVEDLISLLGNPRLAGARWVLVHDPGWAPRRLLDALARFALATDCVIDPASQRQDLMALIAAPASAAKPWVAGPRDVDAPPRPNPPAPLDPELLREHGIEPRLLDEAGELRGEILGSALAASDGDLGNAIMLQRAAVDRAAGLQLGDAVTSCRISLSSLYVRAGDEQAALRELEACALEAEQAKRPRAACQALLALAMLHTVGGRGDPAIQAYARGAELGHAADEPLLAIECWRLAADVAMRYGNPTVGADCLRRSLSIASAAPPDVVASSAAPEAARQLASIYVGAGMHDDAAEAHRLADEYESPPPEAAPDAR